MIHLSNFHAVRYRGIDGLALPTMAGTNLITGANGVGKTALIEAMWLFSGRHNPSLLWNPNVQRAKSPPMDPISRLTDGKLEAHGVEGGARHELKCVFERVNGTYSGNLVVDAVKMEDKDLPPVAGFVRIFHDGKAIKNGTQGIHLATEGIVLYQTPRTPAARPNCVIESARFQHETPADYLQRYSNLVREGRKKDLVHAINIVTEGIEDVEILTNDNRESYLSIMTTGDKIRPLHDFGGGAVRLVRLLLGFSAAKDGIFYSDEIENGIHHTAQRKVWDSVRKWMDRWNVQFVATTHSAEMIDAAIDAFADNPSSLAIHKLFQNEKKGRTDVATFTGDELAGARELNLEVR